MNIICRQTYLFLLSFLAGLFSGFVFDVFRIKRRFVKTSDVFVYMEDIIYWLIISAELFALMYYSNESEIRSYVLFGIFIGVVIYGFIFSKYVFFYLMKVMEVLCKFIKFPINVIKRIFRIFMNVFLRIFNKKRC